MKFTDKACPVLLRRREGRLQILAFRHPKAGLQLIKGTVEADEEPSETVLRELGEESGIEDALLVEPLGQLVLRSIQQRWYIFLCAVERTLPDEWSHYTTDGGGHDFAFFWHHLDEAPSDEWDPAFRTGLGFIQRRVKERSNDSLVVSA